MIRGLNSRLREVLVCGMRQSLLAVCSLKPQSSVSEVGTCIHVCSTYVDTISQGLYHYSLILRSKVIQVLMCIGEEGGGGTGEGGGGRGEGGGRGGEGREEREGRKPVNEATISCYFSSVCLPALTCPPPVQT